MLTDYWFPFCLIALCNLSIYLFAYKTGAIITRKIVDILLR